MTEVAQTTTERVRAYRHTRQWIFGTMLVSALASLTASFVLSVDAIELARHGSKAVLQCNINAIVNCGAVGISPQASLLGFPNAFLGLIAEPVVITIAVASLGKVRFPRWFMFSAQVVYFIGLVFAYWLLSQSMFVIHALCPWCLLVTVSTTLVFASLLHVNVLDDNLYLPARVQAAWKNFFEKDNDILVIVAWLILLAAAIVLKYGAGLFA